MGRQRTRNDLLEMWRIESARHAQLRGTTARLTRTLETATGENAAMRGTIEQLRGECAARETQLAHIALRIHNLTLNRDSVPSAELFVALSEIGR